MGAVVGLILGAGLLLIWMSMWPSTPRPPRTPDWYIRLDDDLRHANMGAVTPRALLGMSLGLASVVALVLLALTGVPAIAACFAAMAFAAPLTVVRSRARRRRDQVRELWPDVVDHVASAVRAGMSLPEALSQLALRGPDSLRPQFAQFSWDYRASGHFDESLDALKDRMADPVADRIVESLRLTRDVGGTDLGKLLSTLSAFLRDDNRTRGELVARQSWTIAGAKLAVAAPWIILAFLGTRPEAAQAYNSTTGAFVLISGGVASLVAYQIMVRIGRLPREPRVLR